MTTISERIKFLLTKEGLKQRDLADSLSTSPQTVHNWIKRDSLSREAAQQISEKFGYSLDWLLSGTGSPKKDQESSIPLESEWGVVDSWDKNTPISADEVEVPFLKDIEFACGDGRVQCEDHNGFKLRFSKATLRRVGANSDGSGVLCFPASGDSMEPVIPDGATVAVDTGNKRIIDGELYAINQGELKRIKQLYRKPGGKLLIRSINRDYDDEEAEESEVEIIGFVFWYSVLRYRR
ncbi:TPA: XRE family transcriptional regulator [Enterobacter roggenkampii]|uniref:XRE family transcriptional regulator n=1 Tax=Enterobacteriaceae TaxID=543 RepID=UPI000BEAE025|nr:MULTISPECIES: helix-turn-helix transcriptional regulator [Enterobacteriaceae]HAS1952253.1 helix-turn-helix transcriptional regulator [Enterobacter asburiae]EEZ4426973.1 helix-turn-helix transcriptional regulator [Escherichia coli]EFD5695647.1 helix-turn-helix transcriptional regulator [Escherichia coli]EFH7192402.1 helix-turn-helix domain-containing protein [Escherichia coli]EFN4284153.1 helix-turn-helix transcriptional regulator [Escherichia coli]